METLDSSHTNGKDTQDMNFEEAMEELETIVQALEAGDVELEKSISLYERGEKLKSRCEEVLRTAEMRVQNIRLNEQGQPVGAQPLDTGSTSEDKVK